MLHESYDNSLFELDTYLVNSFWYVSLAPETKSLVGGMHCLLYVCVCVTASLAPSTVPAHM